MRRLLRPPARVPSPAAALRRRRASPAFAALTSVLLLGSVLRTPPARGDDGTNPPAPAPPAGAAPATEAEEDRKEQIDRHVERGWKAFRGGNHEEALTRMERLAKLD